MEICASMETIYHSTNRTATEPRVVAITTEECRRKREALHSIVHKTFRGGERDPSTIETLFPPPSPSSPADSVSKFSVEFLVSKNIKHISHPMLQLRLEPKMEPVVPVSYNTKMAQSIHHVLDHSEGDRAHSRCEVDKGATSRGQEAERADESTFYGHENVHNNGKRAEYRLVGALNREPEYVCESPKLKVDIRNR